VAQTGLELSIFLLQPPKKLGLQIHITVLGIAKLPLNLFFLTVFARFVLKL
jgi:hypothetical protein